MNKHLCLVFTPIDKIYQDALTHYAPPLGLVALANYVSVVCPDTKVSILDGSVTHTMADIISFIEKEKPDIVGQSVQLISYRYALEIARCARDIGAINVVGGHHASQLADTIASCQEGLLDFVVVGDGEDAITGILKNEPIIQIPNLVFAKSGQIFKTKRSFFDLKNAPPLDYSMIDVAPYQHLLKNSNFNNTKNPVSNYIRTYSHKGCGNRGESVGCIFCGRSDMGVRFKEPGSFWKDVEGIINPNETNYVFDVGDDFLYDYNWLATVLSLKPEFRLSIEFGIFGRANRVTQDVAKMLSKLNVSDVVIGFESGDEEVLRKCNKRDTTPETNISAAKLLFSNGIDVCASFVLGLPGETKESLRNTVRCAKKIVELANELLGRPPREMVANLIEPSPGSTAYRKIAKKFPEKYSSSDRISLEELQKDYFRVYFNLETPQAYDEFRTTLAGYSNEIHSLVSFSDSQGWIDKELSMRVARTKV
ncbi:MAG: radical SAM protein [Thiotrichaceae bacterium IS1]|nr:MAG: radical SAM protein [Thiotrichaceae bacterium IS1]